MSKFGVKLKDTYPGHYDSETFNPQIINIRTGRKGNGRTHHCPVCEGAATTSCYNKLHLAYCRTKVTIRTDDDGEDKLDICGIRFAVISPHGCGTHKYPEHNMYLKNIRKGESPYEAHDDSIIAEKMADLQIDQEPKAWQDYVNEEIQQKRERREEAAQRKLEKTLATKTKGTTGKTLLGKTKAGKTKAGKSIKC